MAEKGALDLTIKISGKLDKSLQTALNSATTQVSDFSRGLSTVGKMGLAAMGAMGTAGVAAIIKCTDEAAKFENEMGDVVKYVSGLADTAGKVSNKIADETKNSLTFGGNTYAENYSAIKSAILNLSTQIPYTAEDLTRLAAAAGQSGKALDDLITYDSSGNVSGFLKDVAMMGTAMDISADQAGDWAAKWEQAFNINHDQVMEVSDQINYLGANSATTAAEIAEVVNKAASLGQVGGMSVSTTAAMGDAMLAMGVDASRAATSIKNMTTRVSMGASATDRQKEAWEELGLTAEGVASSMQVDSQGTWLDIFTRIKNIDADRQVAVLKDLFGQWSIEGAAKITGNIDAFVDALNMVNDPSLYTGSMEREFIIKSDLPEAVDTMVGNAERALAIDAGQAFLPLRKSMGLMKLDFLDKIRDNLPDISRLAEKAMPLIQNSVEKVGDTIINTLPYVEKIIDYITNNGEQAAKIFGGVTATFGAMAFAPQIEGGLRGIGSFLFGKSGAGGIVGGGGSGGRRGGIFGTLSSMYHGGQNAAGKAGGLFNAASIGANLANNSLTAQAINSQATTGAGGMLAKIQNGAIGAFYGLKNYKGLLGPDKGKRGRANPFFSSLMTTAGQITNAKDNGGILGMITGAFSASPVGKYVGGIRSAAGNMANTSIGGSILNGLRGTGGVAKEIFSGIFSENGILPANEDVELVKGVFGLMKDSALGKAGALANLVANSGIGQTVSGAIGKVTPIASGIAGKGAALASGAAGMAGNIGSFASAGAGLLGSIWGQAAGGFGSLFVGALPIVGAISGVIAVLSILYDNMDGVRNLIGQTFGDQGLAVFDTFKGGLDSVLSFITGLFDGGVVTALQPVQDAITNMFGADAGAAFGGVVQILQAVMGVVGQIVNFATTTVKPIITDIFTFITGTVMPIILQTFTEAAPFITTIITNLGSAVMTGMQIIGSAIQMALPYIETIITVIMSIASIAIPAVLAGFSVFSEGISAVITAVQGIFDGLVTFITGVFTGNWSMAWDGVKQIFSNAFDALVTLCKTPINAVIAVINGAIDGINKVLGSVTTIPDWVPGVGGKGFSMQLPTIPMLARGGFTNGVSIAGEAGTEAVISFQSGVRGENIATWMRAGQMLGVNMAQAMAAAGDNTAALDLAVLDSGRNNGVNLITDIGAADQQSGNTGDITFAPQIIIQGNGDRDVLEEALRIAQERFERWYEQMQRRKTRVAY